MIDESNHVDPETLSAYADGELNVAMVSRVERHLSECGACRETLGKVRALVTAAQALARDIAPPPEVWTTLRERVAREPAVRYRRRWWHNGWLASAAAIVLVLGTAVLTSRTAGKAKGAKLPPSPASVAPARAIAGAPVQPPVVLATVERNYSATLNELRETLDAQRATLSPATVRTVERSLALIDAAIAEARAALASDPGNQALVDILSGHYERKVDLLQRATELSSSL